MLLQMQQTSKTTKLKSFGKKLEFFYLVSGQQNSDIINIVCSGGKINLTNKISGQKAHDKIRLANNNFLNGTAQHN